MINQRNRMLKLRSPWGSDACVVTAFSGRDCVSDVYRYQLILQLKGRQLQARDAIGVVVTLELYWGESPRYFHGVIDSWTDMGIEADGTACLQLTIVPHMALLALARHNRIFENVSSIDIVRKLLVDCGEQVDSSRLRQYARREICTQYAETDLEFVNRLLAEEGIAYFFRHEEESYVCVLVDMPSGFGNSRPASCEYVPAKTEMDHRYNTVTTLRRHIRMGNESLTSTDYSEYSAAAPITAQSTSHRDVARAAMGEIQLHGRHYFQRASEAARHLYADLVSSQLTRWQTALDVKADHTVGASAVAGIGAGLRIEITDGVSDAVSNLLMVSVDHYATDGNSQATIYRNSFIAVDAAVGYAPGQSLARSMLMGTHSAKVVAVKDPASEGALGEVRLKFPWEQEQASCWARVAQLYAGNRWGSYFIPEAGQEVLVEFLNGDPDRPVVVGALYNRDNSPVPFTRTQSGIRSGSKNFNELRFDDREGAEEVFFRAGRDHHYRTNNDEIGAIGNSRSVTIGSDDTVICSGNQNLNVAGNITIAAGQSITLQVGSSVIRLEPACITLQAAIISLHGTAQVELEAGAVMDIKGGIVQINS